ncbi:MAG: T9SS type A sorting domain-containing protein [candidate division KSB1 bacterium]|nr:T9SS type A sorting domain-containing protein [candidate division KSB1 bacterium]MDZ7304207.1 T9SS type A sorting domain-containing protein [candidate division KSB1 bacterium]MDZ7313423.1 T9SS type A sorting domain-containing protein [candidate division KSB1 bacterium]
MKRILYSLLVMLSGMGLSTSVLHAQLAGLRGDDRETRIGVHAGNQFRISFFNDGTFGGRVSSKTNPLEVAGEWPINSGHYYVVDGNPFVGSEVVDASGVLTHIISENKSVNISQTRGDRDPVTNEWWTFLPLPGFANPSNDKIAMAKGGFEWSNSWPAFWPDKFDDPTDPGWRNDNIDKNPDKAAWNGYFGKNIFNADEESYFVADDYMNREFNFYPDSTDLKRRGLGLRMYVRGFQWAKAAVEDGIFILYDLENIGTYLHDKMVFGFKVGNNMGESNQGADAGDDEAAYSRELDIAYMWDGDDLGAGNWSPVGYMGGAFLESPGNPYDGIDNDNDGRNFPGPTITETMFQPKPLGLHDKIVLVNYSNFRRTVTTLADTLAKLGKDTLEVRYRARIFKFWAGKVLQEIGDNLVDDNLNGLIDENRGRQDQAGVFHYVYIGDDGVGYKYIDYFSGNGMSNPLLDERRDDGIDNDGDWDPLFDDTGTDGLAPGAPGYPGKDYGEGDGKPTSGEPHFDKTDIDESDMLGLTSFFLYDWNDPATYQYNDEGMWNGLAPGTFFYTFARANVELLYGSGYFPMVPRQIERFSMAVLCGTDLGDLVRNKGYFAQAYNQNYNFAKAPYIPKVRAVAGDNRVALFWDDFAESSVDPISGRDFEGYKIYRSTDPGFNDAKPITDSYGSVIFREPIAQFDLDNTYSGLATVATQGVHFYLGNNTGIRHFWVDTTAINGFTYFYAVTSYDHGDPVLGIDPSECTKFVAIQASGEIEKGTNVVVVRPEAPAAGFTPGKLDDSGILRGPQNTADGTVKFTIIDQTQIKNDHTYRITFSSRDTTTSTGASKQTAGFTLVDKTSGDTLLANNPLTGGSGGLPVTDGFQLSFSGNPPVLAIDPDRSGWSRAGIPAYDFRRYSFGTQPVELIPADFEIIFGDLGVDTSKAYRRGTATLPAIPVNFTILNKLTNKKVPFALRERDTARGGPGVFSFQLSTRFSDEIIFLADPEKNVASWWVRFSISSSTQPDTLMPGPGDVLTLTLAKPFLAHDTFEFKTLAPQIDPELAKTEMERIRVVPNPYIVTNAWEPRNPYSDGRGERALHFIHLPAKCTIKIFNIRGQLVNTLEHDAPINDGTEIWNMLSKDNLEISYGIYIYHVKAEGIGEKTGKFVVVK